MEDLQGSLHVGHYGGECLNVIWLQAVLTQTAGARRLVLYWYQSEGGTFTGELSYRFALLKERLAGRSAGMLVVRIATPVLESDSSIEQAQIRVKNLALQVQQELNRIIHVRRGYP